MVNSTTARSSPSSDVPDIEPITRYLFPERGFIGTHIIFVIGYLQNQGMSFTQFETFRVEVVNYGIGFCIVFEKCPFPIQRSMIFFYPRQIISNTKPDSG